MKLKDVIAKLKGETLTKSTLCEVIAANEGLPVNVVKKVINAEHEMIVQEVAQNNTVQLKGFATFSARYAAGYEARNPRTGEPVDVPERVLPTVRFGEPFKRTVNAELRRAAKSKEETDERN